ncbi:DNA polymerase IV [Christensenellaceae bacterium]|nr:DNA polymerase IV [Christensenellaceae bacterium]BDF61816.1 DNA polymerase IV [Christensenellaceae bacterium]
MDRIILHSDLNSFYASVECLKNPELRNVPMAVGGSTSERHGIIYAKNDLAKKAGVKTGQALWEAHQVCDGLVIVPPHMEEYIVISERVREIYNRFSCIIEPYGIDECWIDCTGSAKLFGSGVNIAQQIMDTVKREIGMTVSIGVSFNKIFAKFGSDYKKPAAITEITRENFRDIVWPCPIEDLFGIGRRRKKSFNRKGLYKIGDIAKYGREHLVSWFGKVGGELWDSACGLDEKPISPYGYVPPVKSVSSGITCTSDLLNQEEAKKVIFDRSLNISHSLRKHGLAACGVEISVRDINLHSWTFQGQIPYVTQAWHDIAEQAFILFCKRYRWSSPIRSLTVRAISLVPSAQPEQLSLLHDQQKRAKNEILEKTIESIKKRFGKRAVLPALLIKDTKIPVDSPGELMKMPNLIYG